MAVVPAWPLVGRVEELEFVLETVRASDGRGTVIAGGIGVGKTRLAREAAAVLADEFVVEWATATQASASVPFGALAHLLPDLGVSSSDDRLRLLRGITEALAQRAAGRPLLLAVDDAQWLDPGAAAVVEHLVTRRLGKVVLTLRTGEAASDPIVGLWKDGRVERLELQPLTSIDVEALVASVLDQRVDRTTLGRFWTLSKGNPLFLRELVLGALETGAFTETDGVWSWTGGFGPSTRLSAILDDRLARVSDGARNVLDHLAVGEPLPLETLAALCDPAAIGEVEAAGLATVDADEPRNVRLAHPLYAEALRAAMPAVDRQRVMVQLADRLQDQAKSSRDHLLRVAAWRLESHSSAPEWLFTEAAEIANAVFDHVLAERLARRGVAEGGGFRASLALGEALSRQGRSNEGLAVLDALPDLASSDSERVAVAINRYFALTNEHGFLLEFEDGLVNAERKVSDPGLRRFLRAQRATLLCFAGKLAEGIAQASEPFDVADGDEVDELSQLRAVPGLAGAWLCCGKPDSACALGERMLEPALRRQVDLPQAPSWVISTQLPSLIASGRLDDADAAREMVEAAMASMGGGSADGPSFIALAHGMSALLRGRSRTAQHALRESVIGMRRIAPWRRSFPLAYLTEACALVGDAEGAAEASAEADEVIVNAAIFEGMARRARGWAAVAHGQRSKAVERFLDAAEWASETGQLSSGLWAAHDALRYGARRQAVALLQALVPRTEGRWGPVFADHGTAVVAGDGDALEDVAGRFEEIGALLLAAEAAAEASVAFAQAGLRARADRAAARARVLADSCEGVKTPALEELAQPLPLTARELEVVRLAADGLSANAIAERLFVSTRTVEGHLHRAYNKLGVNDRRGLIRLLKATN